MWFWTNKLVFLFVDTPQNAAPEDEVENESKPDEDFFEQAEQQASSSLQTQNILPTSVKLAVRINSFVFLRALTNSFCIFLLMWKLVD